jgi:2,3-bisphosphoglycerate-independent phosphoglycerate mutase
VSTLSKLAPHPGFGGVEGPVLVVVMDGVGLGRRDEGDAVHLARSPNLDWLIARTPGAHLAAHGTSVGLPSDDDMGNSEVGHNALGAGRVFDQGAKLVGKAIESGAIFEGETWREALKTVGQSGEPLHLIGLLSDGNVHSHIDHLFALIRRADQEGVKALRVHALLDGRDVPEKSAMQYVEPLEALLSEITEGAQRDYRVASGGGRMTTTMDRYEADWGMVKRGWEVHVKGEGRGFLSLSQAVRSLYEEDPEAVDQNLPSFVIREESGAPVGPIRDGAAVLFLNFRGDRGIEISRAFEEEQLSAFERGPRPAVFYAGMMQYDGDLQIPKRFLVKPPTIDRTMGEHLAASGISQLAISETQKFGHVTYFWNGNRSGAFDPKIERYIEIPSDTRPFEERPWMKAAEITDTLIEELRSGRHRFARVNYANGDMVGHTGDREAAIVAVEAVDLCLGRLLPAIRQLKGAVIVTADHGNADQMFEIDKKTHRLSVDAHGELCPKTSHTLNPVPCHIYAPGQDLSVDPAVVGPDRSSERGPGLANVAATALFLLGLEAPEGYLPSLLLSSPHRS